MELPVLSFELVHQGDVHDTFDYGRIGCVLVVSFGSHEVDRMPFVSSEYWFAHDVNQVTAEAVEDWLGGVRGGEAIVPLLEGWTWSPRDTGDGRWIPMENE